jgi:Heavy metal associated domain 2
MPDPQLPVAQVEHRIPGRMRLRVSAMRGDAGFFRRAETDLARVPGVRAVRVNPHTASILIEHGGDEAEVLSGAKTRGLFKAAPPPSRPSAIVTGSGLASVAVGGEAFSPLDLASAGLAGAGLLQLVRGQVFGSASENLWNAYGLYTMTRHAWPSTLLVAFGLLQIMRGEVLGSATSLFLYAFAARRMAQGQPVEDPT